MKKLFFTVSLGLAGCLAGSGILHADDTVKRVQQSLRDQGFYYGAIDGTPGDETTHAIRRYQIRNGLPVSGQLDAATIASVDRAETAVAKGPDSPSAKGGKITGDDPRSGGAAGTNDDRRYAQGNGDDAPRRATPAPAPSYRAPAQARPAPDDQDEEDAPPARPPVNRPDLRVAPPPAADDDRPPRNGIPPSAPLTAVFEQTPYEFAPPPVQADLLRRAQTILLRDGYYDGEANGRPNPVTFEALANFQGVNHLRRTGRLDMRTLARMGLLRDRRAEPPRGPYDDGRREPPPVYEGRVTR